MNFREETLQIHASTMAELKDFQLATVERIDSLFRKGQNRVLVADEVGLGKTLIAKGTIAKTALLHCEKNPNKLFNVVYICSNQVIANQNIRKLDVFETKSVNRVNDDRLSMQHLKISQQKKQARDNGNYVQLIPLTPTTSFSIANGGGSKEERALIFAVLKRLDKFKDANDKLSQFLSKGVNNWQELIQQYSGLVDDSNSLPPEYPNNVIKRIEELDKNQNIFSELELCLKENRSGRDADKVIMKLRRMFAQVSVEMLEPDLVIMDEFQRFKYLMDPSDEESETRMLVEKFFGTEELKVLLLSATPYKLYSTMEEIEENGGSDEHYKEFLQVVKFLENDTGRMDKFLEVWSNYSIALQEIAKGNIAILKAKKAAEYEMYEIMTRTERISVMDSGDYLDISGTHKPISVTEGDIKTYLDMGKLLSNIGINKSFHIDYAKSSPYLMSFMNKYEAKKQITNYFKGAPQELSKAKSNYLWIDRNNLINYGEISSNNARLEKLKKIVFNQGSELYMWVPPSMPYYALEGVYKDSKNFSKVLVFSSWEMVPKMIASLISYEAERLTVGKISPGHNNNTYFTKSSSRYPQARLRFTESEGMYMFCLLYPSETLAEIYHPIEYMNKGYSLNEIRESLKEKLKKLMDSYIKKFRVAEIQVYSKKNVADIRWYYLAPMLLDGLSYFEKWKEAMLKMGVDELNVEDDNDTSNLGKNFRKHIDDVEKLLKNFENELNTIPADLFDVLANMAIGSFAVCAYRANGGDLRRSSEIAKIFVNRFNSTEATACVKLAYPNKTATKTEKSAKTSKNATDNVIDGFNDKAHWRKVLKYCCDGGFGAMLDEYIHLVTDGRGFGLSEERNENIHNNIIDALTIHQAPYVIDTFNAFGQRLRNETEEKTYMRTHYAVAFAKSDDSKSKNVVRKDSVRNAFNSPMRPFVLATTSIGQEGLDFHQYCRKIVHWNLPSNPIDLEQREGRINRYKCLAIRQDIAQRYYDYNYSKDVWHEAFEFAANEIREKGQSELVPYWCLGKNQNVKIERIIPMYPLSYDEIKYERLIKVLSLYRLTMGQTRQEELVDYFLKEGIDKKEETKDLFINLSPYVRTNDDWREKTEKREPIKIEKKKSERQIKIENLIKEVETLSIEYTKCETKMDSIPTYQLLGMSVKHNKFGSGKIISIEKEEYIRIAFPCGVKEFHCWNAFKQGLLISEYDGYVESVNCRKELEMQANELKLCIAEKKAILETLTL